MLAQLDRRPGLPAGLHRGADRVLPRPRGATPADRARATVAQPAAPARLEGPRDGRAECRGPEDHRAPVRGMCRPFRVRPGAPRRRSGSAYRLDPGLVRGLDYYTRTAFEFYVVGREGQQQAIGGGGRYDGLVELLGGRPTPGIGFGIGLDRVILALAAAGVTTDGGVPSPVAVVVGADPDDTVGPTRSSPRELRAAGDRGPRRAGAAQARQAAGGGGPRRGPLRGDRRRRARGRRGPAPRPAGRHPEGSPARDLAREVARAHGAHHHGDGSGG